MASPATHRISSSCVIACIKNDIEEQLKKSE